MLNLSINTQITTALADFKTYGAKSYVSKMPDVLNAIYSSRIGLLDPYTTLDSAKYLLSTGKSIDDIVVMLGFFNANKFIDTYFYEGDTWTAFSTTLRDHLFSIWLNSQEVITETIDMLGDDAIKYYHNVYVLSATQTVYTLTLNSTTYGQSNGVYGIPYNSTTRGTYCSPKNASGSVSANTATPNTLFKEFVFLNPYGGYCNTIRLSGSIQYIQL